MPTAIIWGPPSIGSSRCEQFAQGHYRANQLRYWRSEQRLVTDVFLCEDAHAQERSLLPEMLETVQANDLWIADRNFCTRAALMGIAQRQAYFVIRVHRNLPWEALEPLQPAGSSATGEIFEQRVTITYEGTSLTLRRIVVKLWPPQLKLPSFTATGGASKSCFKSSLMSSPVS